MNNARSPFVYVKLQPVPKAPRVIGPESKLLNDALFNVDGLADSATLFFRGLFPHEAPHGPWGSHRALPWFGRYESNPDACGEAICDMSKQVLGGRTVVERGPLVGECYEVDFDTNLHLIQFLAVEALLALEGLVQSIAERSLASALSWQFAAFANISEASVHAMQMLHESSCTLHGPSLSQLAGLDLRDARMH